MRRRIILLVYSFAVCFSSVLRADETGLPDGFEVTTFASAFAAPTALAFAPDGRLFVAEKDGGVLIVSEDGSTVTLLTHIDVYSQSECGLIGMALDPSFSENHFIYLFATVSSDTQQIIRITEVGDTATDHTVIRDNLPTSGQVHNGGGLRVSPDGKLYFSIGDTGMRELSQQMHTFAGKVCRINLDGSTPEDNPFVTPTGTPRAIYALGFRNPFRFCFAPDGRLLVMDVGSSGDARREEINLVSAGANFGWPVVEGFADPGTGSAYVDPIIAYDAEGSAITGCAFYNGDQFPDDYRGDLFHLDFTSHKLFRLKLNEDSVVSHELFHQAAGGPVDLAVGPEGGLYYAELFGGTVMRIRYGTTAGNTDAEDGLPAGGDPDDFTDPDSATDHDGTVGESRETDETNRPCGAGILLAALLTFAGLLTLRFVRSGAASGGDVLAEHPW